MLRKEPVARALRNRNQPCASRESRLAGQKPGEEKSAISRAKRQPCGPFNVECEIKQTINSASPSEFADKLSQYTNARPRYNSLHFRLEPRFRANAELSIFLAPKKPYIRNGFSGLALPPKAPENIGYYVIICASDFVWFFVQHGLTRHTRPSPSSSEEADKTNVLWKYLNNMLDISSKRAVLASVFCCILDPYPYTEHN